MTCPEQEQYIMDHEFFILRTARIATGKRITKADDEWSIALSAFWEAMEKHDPSKGTLEAYPAGRADTGGRGFQFRSVCGKA